MEKGLNTLKNMLLMMKKNEAKIGDTVRIAETRPLSKTKHFRLVKIIEKAVIL